MGRLDDTRNDEVHDDVDDVDDVRDVDDDNATFILAESNNLNEAFCVANSVKISTLK